MSDRDGDWLLCMMEDWKTARLAGLMIHDMIHDTYSSQLLWIAIS